MSENSEIYEQRILELKSELSSREIDIESYKKALSDLNMRVQSLVGRLSQDIKSMQLLQKALVPTEMPNVPGFSFSTKFHSGQLPGGDYFDIFEQGDRSRFGIVVGSASDYTTSALLLATLLGVSNRASYPMEPHTLIQNIGRELAPQFADKVSVDLFHSSFDRRNYVLKYCMLGKVQVFHQNYETGELSSLAMNSKSLHKRLESFPEGKEIPLSPRDRLVIATRGLILEKNAEGEAYGAERLMQSILEAPRDGVHELRNHVLFSLEQFVQNSAYKYDRTLIVLEVKDKVIKLA